MRSACLWYRIESASLSIKPHLLSSLFVLTDLPSNRPTADSCACALSNQRVRVASRRAL